MKRFFMSPTSHVFIKSGKPNFCKSVVFKTNNSWDYFHKTNSVNRYAVLKDVQKTPKTPEKIISVKVESRFGIVFRDIKPKEKRIVVYGIYHTKRYDGVFREVSLKNPQKKELTTKKVKAIIIPTEEKKGKRIVRVPYKA
jgi:hypothetical protein